MKMSFVFALVSGLFSLPAHASIETVPFVDVGRYQGTWFEISRNPLFFEAGCTCAIQKLAPGAGGVLDVKNSCNLNSINGPLQTISGTAVSEDRASNSKFTVDFGLPHKGEYWIIGLDHDYRYAVVSDPSGKSLYILSKTPTLDPSLYSAAVSEASRQLDVSKLEITVQTGCSYP